MTTTDPSTPDPRTVNRDELMRLLRAAQDDLARAIMLADVEATPFDESAVSVRLHASKARLNDALGLIEKARMYQSLVGMVKGEEAK